MQEIDGIAPRPHPKQLIDFKLSGGLLDHSIATALPTTSCPLLLGRLWSPLLTCLAAFASPHSGAAVLTNVKSRLKSAVSRHNSDAMTRPPPDSGPQSQTLTGSRSGRTRPPEEGGVIGPAISIQLSGTHNQSTIEVHDSSLKRAQSIAAASGENAVSFSGLSNIVLGGSMTSRMVSSFTSVSGGGRAAASAVGGRHPLPSAVSASRLSKTSKPPHPAAMSKVQVPGKDRPLLLCMYF